MDHLNETLADSGFHYTVPTWQPPKPEAHARGIRIRADVHIGECERRGEEWSGMAVHAGARIGALAGAGEVLASRTVRDLSAGSGLTFESLGPQRFKGLPEQVDVYRVTTPNERPNAVVVSHLPP